MPPTCDPARASGVTDDATNMASTHSSATESLSNRASAGEYATLAGRYVDFLEANCIMAPLACGVLTAAFVGRYNDTRPPNSMVISAYHVTMLMGAMQFPYDANIGFKGLRLAHTRQNLHLGNPSS